MLSLKTIAVNPLAVGKHYNPMMEDAWDVGEFDCDLVLAADDAFIAKHHGDVPHSEASEKLTDTQEYHVARVAYLVKNKDENPIVLDFFQFPRVNGYAEKMLSVLDGNHRLSAAIIREDELIMARVQHDSKATFNFIGYIQNVVGVRF